MKHPTAASPRIAYGDELTPRSEVLAETLRTHGYQVELLPGRREFLAAPEPNVYLLARALADGCTGLELFAELRRVGRSAPVVLLDERPTFAELRRAVELDAADFVLRPEAPGELAGALARVLESRPPSPENAALPALPGAALYERTYPAEPDSVGWAARELAAFLLGRSVPAAHRVRIASAVAELVDNASRHAYPDGAGTVAVTAEVAGSRVRLCVQDRGRGFDHATSALEHVPAALPRRPLRPTSTGLHRAGQLSEELRIRSGPGGTRLELSFELTPAHFEEEIHDLSETDFLDPLRARRLITLLAQGRVDFSNVPPSLAPTIGRLLGGLGPERTAPWKRS